MSIPVRKTDRTTGMLTRLVHFLGLDTRSRSPATATRPAGLIRPAAVQRPAPLPARAHTQRISADRVQAIFALPHAGEFPQVAAQLAQNDCVSVTQVGEILVVVRDCRDDPHYARTMVRRAWPSIRSVHERTY